MNEEKREKETSVLPEEPQEVISWYTPRRREGQEVVSYYVHSGPLPRNARRQEAPPKKKKKSRRGLWICLGCLAALAVIVVAAAVITSLNDHSDREPSDGDASSIVDLGGEVTTSIPTVKAEEGVRLIIENAVGKELTIQEVYARVNPAVVTVVAEDSYGSSVGTGVIMTEDGYFLTNAHVIDGGERCWIILSTGQTYDARLVGYDAHNDLAVLKAVDAKGLPTASFGNSDTLLVGDTVYAIGNPLGVELRGTLTDGIISAINRAVEMDGRMMTLLQTNAALNSGNSGGPLINAYGQVIGINVMKMSNTDLSWEATVEGLGFALPISDMSFVANDILRYGEYRGAPTIGITVVMGQAPDGSTAVVVYEVVENLGAQAAGVQPGDVILAADGYPISLTSDLLIVRRSHSVGETVRLTLRRGDEVFDVDILLQASKGR